ncbi:hypothetical protein DPX39_000017100 [Trypanosoma brucei equiperdum]|uniref:Uncharacterized protein n=1 Tax=Trypanosoma brucei equiperdum TaxID=630700 RepID=A0A3L6KSB1_9TRYP|nr:hypothetical protein DPX39_000017100 [Trypanosoma brucei equiperdum]
MFSWKDVLSTVIYSTPQFLLRQMSSVLLGLVAGYCSILLLFGPLPFAYGILQLTATVLIAYALAVATRYGVRWGACSVLALMDGGVWRVSFRRKNNTGSARSGETQLD